jgi:hypothetical protein
MGICGGERNTSIPTFSPTMADAIPMQMPAMIELTLIPTDYPIGPPPDLDNPILQHWNL